MNSERMIIIQPQYWHNNFLTTLVYRYRVYCIHNEFAFIYNNNYTACQVINLTKNKLFTFEHKNNILIKVYIATFDIQKRDGRYQRNSQTNKTKTNCKYHCKNTKKRQKNENNLQKTAHRKLKTEQN